MDKVSVIVPVYNVRDYLDDCVSSILAQTYTNFEILLIDDGSTDGSGILCDSYQDNPMIRVFHQTNSGVTAARSLGVSNSDGKWIVFVDSDDVLVPNALEYWINCASENQVQLVVSRCGDIIDGKYVPLKSKLQGKFTRLDYLKLTALGYISPGIGGKMYLKDFFEDKSLNMSNKIKNNEDLLMNFRISDKMESVFCDTKSFYYCNIRENSASHTFTPSENWFLLYNELFNLINSQNSLSIYTFILRSLALRHIKHELTHEECLDVLSKFQKYNFRLNLYQKCILEYVRNPNFLTLNTYRILNKIKENSRPNLFMF